MTQRRRRERTLSRDLTRVFFFTGSLIFLTAGFLESFLLYHREMTQLRRQAHTLINNLALSLAQAAIQENAQQEELEQQALNRIIDRYDNFAIVTKIQVQDALGHSLASSHLPERAASFSLKQTLPWKGGSFVAVSVSFSDKSILEKEVQNACFTAATFLALLLVYWLTTQRLLRTLLQKPLDGIKTALLEISQGNFQPSFPSPPQNDLKVIIAEAKLMAEKLVAREAALAASSKAAAQMETEMALAQAVQLSMLPTQEVYCAQNLALTWSYKPMKQVGGDWFYFWHNPKSAEFFAMMGDVTGHGIAPGVLSTAVSGALRLLAILKQTLEPIPALDPGFIMTCLQKLIHSTTQQSHLAMTCIVLRIDTASMRLDYCSAGHPFPLLLAPQGETLGIQALVAKQRGPVLGTLEGQDYTYQHCSLPLPEKASLLLYTDGLTAAKDLQGRSFARGLRRSLAQLPAHACLDQIQQQVISQFEKHCQDRDADDDVCLLLIQRQ